MSGSAALVHEARRSARSAWPARPTTLPRQPPRTAV